MSNYQIQCSMVRDFGCWVTDDCSGLLILSYRRDDLIQGCRQSVIGVVELSAEAVVGLTAECCRVV